MESLFSLESLVFTEKHVLTGVFQPVLMFWAHLSNVCACGSFLFQPPEKKPCVPRCLCGIAAGSARPRGSGGGSCPGRPAARRMLCFAKPSGVWSSEMSVLAISIPEALPGHPPSTAPGVRTCVQAARRPVLQRP